MTHLRAVFNALRAARLFGNLEKCTFCTDRVVFFGYVVTALLNELTKKDVPFVWGDAQQEAFMLLKDKLTHAPLLQLSDFNKTFELECDASGIG